MKIVLGIIALLIGIYLVLEVLLPLIGSLFYLAGMFGLLVLGLIALYVGANLIKPGSANRLLSKLTKKK